MSGSMFQMRTNQEVFSEEVTFELGPKKAQGRPGRIKWAGGNKSLCEGSELGMNTMILRAGAAGVEAARQPHSELLRVHPTRLSVP